MGYCNIHFSTDWNQNTTTMWQIKMKSNHHKNEIKLPHNVGPVEQLWFLGAPQAPVASPDGRPVCAPEHCAGGCMSGQVPLALENHSVPVSVPPELPDRLGLPLSITLVKQMLSISGRCAHHSFNGTNGSVSSSSPSFSIPSRSPAVGFLPFIQETAALPARLCGAFGLTWS